MWLKTTSVTFYKTGKLYKLVWLKGKMELESLLPHDLHGFLFYTFIGVGIYGAILDFKDYFTRRDGRDEINGIIKRLEPFYAEGILTQRPTRRNAQRLYQNLVDEQITH